MGEIEHEVDESEAITAKIMNCQERIHEAIRAPTGPSATVVPTPTAVPTSVPISCRPKLPKLTLPRFKGELTTWTTFWDSFKSTVHENPGMSKIDKFSYLKSLVEGPASGCIQGLTLSDTNYDAAITMLQDRFGRPQQIITAHMEELLRILGSVGDRPSSLRSTLDKILVHVRGLESLGIGSSQYGSLLIPVIMSKFPNEIWLRAARESNDDVWEIDALLDVIKQEVKARETSEGTHVNPNKATSYNSRSQATSNPTTSSFVTNSNTIRCVYCSGDHFSASSTKIIDVNARRDILKKTGRCFNCLKSHHKSRDCDSRKNCRHCHRRHHQSICEQSVNAGTTQSGIPQSHHIQSRNLQTSNPPSQTVTTSSCSRMSKNLIVLLQTARAVAISLHGAVPVRLLLDNGSQLKLEPEGCGNGSHYHILPIKIET